MVERSRRGGGARIGARRRRALPRLGAAFAASVGLSLGSAGPTGTSAAGAENVRFAAARPVWLAGRSEEMNLTAGFRAVIDLSEARGVALRATASTLYRATVNGKHVGYGPARGPHGYYRVDEWDLEPALAPGKNVVAIEVAGYNVNTYYTLDQPSFLQAEIVQGERVLAATGGPGFAALVPGERVQRVQRYSFQRPFSEVYRLRPGRERWKVDPDFACEPAACEIRAVDVRTLPRRVPYPDFRLRRDWRVESGGTLVRGELPAQVWRDRSLAGVGPAFKGYRESELEVIPSIEMQRCASKRDPAVEAGGRGPLELAAGSWRILDFGLDNTGFVGLALRAERPARLAITFDEVLRDGDVDFKRLGCVNVIWLDLEPGAHEFESFEPYTFRYLKLAALEGICEVRDVWLREYSNPSAHRGKFRASDPRLESLFEAGRETFRQNALDTFMDCPSRERAGWLCDSFFTARVAPDLCGDTSVERTQMENYLLPERFEFLPEGMLPMCYPADHNDGVFIPNWALWFVVQLEEYVARSGDRATAGALEPRVRKLFSYLSQFRNSDGLLEKLPSWVFVEWSAANQYVQDVNYPSNLLYAGALAAAGRLYGDEALLVEAERVRAAVRAQSFDGTFFVDNAVRKPDGSLEVTRNRTEVCQYFAFFFGAATPETHPELWKLLLEDFGPSRAQAKRHPEVGLANAFIGNVLRLELLSRAGLSQKILDESIDYHLYMAERTGTLWENVGDYASCNHGFASHIAHVLYRDVLGAREVDLPGKRVLYRIPDVRLERCEGSIPTPDGPIRLSWRRGAEGVEHSFDVPSGWTIRVENASGLPLRPRG